MNCEPRSSPLQGPQPPITGNRILLLDGNEINRNARAEALRVRGALVDCVGSGADARSVWNPESHDIVLIDLSSTGHEFRDFYEDAHTRGLKQTFGFYLAGPPYITTSIAQYESACKPESAIRPVDGSSNYDCLAVLPTRYRTGAPEAAIRIAVAKRLIRPATINEHTIPRRISFSTAIKNAERILEADRSARTEAE
jgi:hypothetical protein